MCATFCPVPICTERKKEHSDGSVDILSSVPNHKFHHTLICLLFTFCSMLFFLNDNNIDLQCSDLNRSILLASIARIKYSLTSSSGSLASPSENPNLKLNFGKFCHLISILLLTYRLRLLCTCFNEHATP